MFENELYPITEEHKRKLAVALGVSVEDLFPIIRESDSDIWGVRRQMVLASFPTDEKAAPRTIGLDCEFGVSGNYVALQQAAVEGRRFVKPDEM